MSHWTFWCSSQSCFTSSSDNPSAFMVSSNRRYLFKRFPMNKFVGKTNFTFLLVLHVEWLNWHNSFRWIFSLFSLDLRAEDCATSDSPSETMKISWIHSEFYSKKLIFHVWDEKKKRHSIRILIEMFNDEEEELIHSLYIPINDLFVRSSYNDIEREKDLHRKDRFDRKEKKTNEQRWAKWISTWFSWFFRFLREEFCHPIVLIDLWRRTKENKSISGKEKSEKKRARRTKKILQDWLRTRKRKDENDWDLVDLKYLSRHSLVLFFLLSQQWISFPFFPLEETIL